MKTSYFFHFVSALSLIAVSSPAQAASPKMSCAQLDQLASQYGSTAYTEGSNEHAAFTLIFPQKIDLSTHSITQIVGGAEGTLRLNQIRVAYEMYHGSSRGLSLTQMDEKAEGIYFYPIRGVRGLRYDVVSVGFGGGNGAQILFISRTARLAGLQIIDGVDCHDTK